MKTEIYDHPAYPNIGVLMTVIGKNGKKKIINAEKAIKVKFELMVDNIDFRTQLKETREMFNIPQSDFATLLGISQKHLNRIENCHQYPSFPLLYEMCAKLGYKFKLIFNP